MDLPFSIKFKTSIVMKRAKVLRYSQHLRLHRLCSVRVAARMKNKD